MSHLVAGRGAAGVTTRMATRRIDLGGRVQGVGFRPFVYRLARDRGLTGWVRNGAGTVEILASGDRAALDGFAADLLARAPATARPVLLACRDAEAEIGSQGEGSTDFVIRASRAAGASRHFLPPDLAPCLECLAELEAPGDRRFHYPFINCTQCGPRYSLIRCLPYDRAHTAMAAFPLCPACAAEYADPADRRFHAEPVACPVCGPRCWFAAPDAPEVTGEAALGATIAALRRGDIIAVKGVGGYHLFCDAASDASVTALRRRKHRPERPFAVLFADDPDQLAACVDFDPATGDLLRAPDRPIVLLARRAAAPLAASLAPGLNTLGVMLADSPLHHLLITAFGGPLVATSANRSGAPMVSEPAEAERCLAGVADGFLHHDRPIAHAIDDSVIRVIDRLPRTLRAGRGRAPIERRLGFRLDVPVLAVGGHLKSTIALGFEDRVVISPHIGDLDDPGALALLARTARDLQVLYGVRAVRVLTDAHPAYASTIWAREQGLEIVPIWHHAAHAAALVGEVVAPDYDRSDYDSPGRDRLVFTWDGVGLGPDGALWGGEALLGRPGAWRAVARFERFRLQGGERVGREPWRSAAALCWGGDRALPLTLPADAALSLHAWTVGLNCHESSAVGRLFDAASALLGLGTHASYEGQGPALLEALADRAPAGPLGVEALPIDAQGDLLSVDWRPVLAVLLDASRTTADRAARFHEILALTARAIARRVRRSDGITAIGLAGGVFQNRRLAERLLTLLRADGFDADLGREIPCNDAGLSFGQIVEYGYRCDG
ncbi:carbamoyltransferase HypF [Acidiphilium sp.]|uniref:carbamoyltransferase HypF n=1 Tax=Acidiphilium sp. TaxID=527 RepID=UPI003D059954